MVVGDHLKNVAQPDRVEDRFDVMISILPFPYNVEAKVKLRIGKADHYKEI